MRAFLCLKNLNQEKQRSEMNATAAANPHFDIVGIRNKPQMNE
jgi:hypothetical protein